jgi:hypothetical protein
MAKRNPLFIDSTILHGDRIGTQVELHKIALYEDECVYVVITNQNDEVQRVLMKLNDENRYQARVWLGHQKSITYRFVIEKNGKEYLQSILRPARAQYAIIDEWVPVLAEPDARFDNSDKGFVPTQTEGPMLGAYVSSMASLLDKWGL